VRVGRLGISRMKTKTYTFNAKSGRHAGIEIEEQEEEEEEAAFLPAANFSSTHMDLSLSWFTPQYSQILPHVGFRCRFSPIHGWFLNCLGFALVDASVSFSLSERECGWSSSTTTSWFEHQMKTNLQIMCAVTMMFRVIFAVLVGCFVCKDVGF